MRTEPKIRFKEFTDAWEQRKLGEVAKIVMGQSPSSENYTENPNDHILVQGNADIKNNRVVPRVWTTQITKQAQKGDLIISVRAPVGDVGKTDYDVVIGRGVAAIKGNEFVFHILGKMKQSGYWNALSTGSTFESINSTDLNNASVILPTSTEQTVIGDFFRQLDTLLTLHQRKLNELKSFKLTMLSKMFPKHGQTFPEIRLAGFDGEWENVNLGDLVVEHNEIVQGTTGFPIATSSRKGLFLQNEYFDGGRTGIDESIQFHVVPIGYITYRHMSDDSIFKFNRNHYKTDILVSKEYPVFKNNEKSDIDFILYHLNNCPEFRRFSRIQKLGGTRVRLYFKNLVAYKLLIPTLNEQQAIGSFFSNLDDLISSTQSKVDELEILKKKLLQEMFV